MSVQKQALELENRFSEAANKGDMETFKDLVNRRHKLFRRYNGKQNETYSFLNANTGIPPPVHPEVCKWHREENDPECAGCDPEKRTWVKQ